MRPGIARDWRADRARQPLTEGFVDRDGVRTFYEVFGDGEPTILMLPTWSVLHAAHGRFQIADLARHFRVVAFDGRGNGRSDRPTGAAAYDDREFVEDAVAVLDATATRRAVVIACSASTKWLVRLAAEHPDRVLACVSSGTNLPLAPVDPEPPEIVPFHQRYVSTDGWAKFNADYWRHDYEDFLRFFFAQVWTEPHSLSVIDDCVAWGLETTPDTLIDTVDAPRLDEADTLDMVRRIRSPMLVVHGAGDTVTPVERSVRLAEETGGRLVVLGGAGHCSGNRDPVKFNQLVRDFTRSIVPARSSVERWTRALDRPRRVLAVPAGDRLEPARRDLAIIAALRTLRPEVQVEWLADGDVRQLLEASGQVVHPASDELIELDISQPADFATWRRTDEARFVNFMVFADLVADEPFDLVVADGADHVDMYLHANPELKRFAFAWLTDRVGWPVHSEVPDEVARLAADANAEMVASVERYPRLRDRAIYLGGPDDLGAGTLGPGMPTIRDWAELRFGAGGPVIGDETPEAARGVAATLAALL